MKIASLHIYPVKSTRGHLITEATIGKLGLNGDRSAAFLDADGNVLEQRDTPLLAQISSSFTENGMRLSKAGQTDIVATRTSRDLKVKVWDNFGSAYLADDMANTALSQWFDQPVRLAFINPDNGIPVVAEWQGEGVTTGFSDGFPVLITNAASLAALNAISADKGEAPVGMDRFRANIVVDCDTPWDEDLWEAVEIAGIQFDLVKPCARCVMTTQDQLTGSRDVPSPMPAMQHARLSMDRSVVGPLFGWNTIPRGQGTIKAGDTVTVLTRRSERWPLKARG